MRKARVRRKGAGGKLREGMVGALWMARESAVDHGRTRGDAVGHGRGTLDGTGGRRRSREDEGGRGRAR